MANPNIVEAGKNTQFKPGQSGNPQGTKKGTKHISTWINELLNDEEFEALLPDPKEGWKTHKGAPIKAIVRVIAVKAMQGDVKAFDVLAKHGQGSKIQISNDPDNPVIPADSKLANEWTEYLKSKTRE